MRRSALAVAFASAALCSPLLAQSPMPERVIPTNFMWQRQGLLAGVTSDARFVSLQALNVHNAADYWPHQNDPSPENAAALLCAMILAEKQAGRLADDTVAVLLRGFGHDEHQSQPGWIDPPDDTCPGLPQGPAFLPALGFGRSSPRDLNPWGYFVTRPRRD